MTNLTNEIFKIIHPKIEKYIKKHTYKDLLFTITTKLTGERLIKVGTPLYNIILPNVFFSIPMEIVDVESVKIVKIYDLTNKDFISDMEIIIYRAIEKEFTEEIKGLVNSKIEEYESMFSNLLLEIKKFIGILLFN